MTRLDKNSLKLIVKECLIEILAEGIMTRGGNSNSRIKKNALNETLNRASQNTRSIENLGAHTQNANNTQRARPSYLDNISFGSGKDANREKTERLTSKISKDPVMQSILADTANTTLREQVSAETGKGRMSAGASRPVDKAARIVDQSDPTELFGESSQNWAHLAFS